MTCTRLADAQRASTARSGTASCSRSGCWRTTVTIGVPAARYSPANAMTLADHAVDRRAQHVSSSCWRASRQLGAALREHRLAVADFFERVLVAAFGDLRAAASAASRSARAEMPRSTNVAMRSRCRRASSSDACAWRTSAVFSMSIVSPSPVGSRPSRARACCSAASAWRSRRSKSVGVSRAMHLALAAPATRDRRAARRPGR